MRSERTYPRRRPERSETLETESRELSRGGVGTRLALASSHAARLFDTGVWFAIPIEATQLQLHGVLEGKLPSRTACTQPDRNPLPIPTPVHHPSRARQPSDECSALKQESMCASMTGEHLYSAPPRLAAHPLPLYSEAGGSSLSGQTWQTPQHTRIGPCLRIAFQLSWSWASAKSTKVASMICPSRIA